MIWIDYHSSENVAAWTGRQLGAEYDNVCALGVVEDDRLIAGVVLSRWTDHQCEVTIASVSRRWCQRRILADLFAFPFQFVNRLQAVVRHSNKASRALCRRLGFRHEGRLRGCFGEDGHVYGMLKTECGWLTDGQWKRAASA